MNEEDEAKSYGVMMNVALLLALWSLVGFLTIFGSAIGYNDLYPEGPYLATEFLWRIASSAGSIAALLVARKGRSSNRATGIEVAAWILAVAAAVLAFLIPWYMWAQGVP